VVEVEAMSQETSPSTHQPYGVARVIRVWELSRSTFYARRTRRQEPPTSRRRGRPPVLNDAALLDQIRVVIAESPFTGEGHRKIWARLRAVKQVRTAKRRVLRVMRAAGLLAPARQPAPVVERPHTGTIVTDAPNVMWGTDATATVTLLDGQAMIFAAIDHCTAECVGIHAAIHGTRFEALEPVRQGVRDQFGGIAAGIANGLAMRHDNGSQYLSEDFQTELRFLGIASSPAFVRQPEGNGCIERFFRTLKEQLLWVKPFRDVEELRQGLLVFKETYNQQWLIERLGFRSPAHVRRAFAIRPAA
jgi:putative transposase